MSGRLTSYLASSDVPWVHLWVSGRSQKTVPLSVGIDCFAPETHQSRMTCVHYRAITTRTIGLKLLVLHVVIRDDVARKLPTKLGDWCHEKQHH